MRSAITRRSALLGLLASPWLGHVKAAPKVPAQPLIFLSSELQPLRFAPGDERVFQDGLEMRWREWCATRQFHPVGSAKR